MDEEKALAKTTSEGLELSTEQFQQNLQAETERRKLIAKYVQDNLEEGIDYITIPGTKKPSLSKAGAERVSNIFHLRATYRADEDTWNLLPQEKKDIGTFCFICELITPSGEVMAHGKGLADCHEKEPSVYKDGKYVGKKYWPVNTAMKIAKKRAFVDAALNNGYCGLSDRFTQDMEDYDQGDGKTQQGESHGANMATKAQKNAIYAICKNEAFDIKAVLATEGAQSTNDLTKSQASKIIDGLKNNKLDHCKEGAVEDAEEIELGDEDPFVE